MASTKIVLGDGNEGYLIGEPGAVAGPTGVFTTTTPMSGQAGLQNVDGVSLHLIVDFQSDSVAVTGTDNVVAGTGVWTFASYTFTGFVGAKLQISGAANAGNNGTFAITAVSGHTATTATTGLVNETFGPNVFINVIRSETASVPAGAWTVFGSNDFAPRGIAAYGQVENAGHWADISALFSSPSVIAVVATATSQIVQPPGHLSVRSLRVTFTPSAGKGTARCALFAKSWS